MTPPHLSVSALGERATKSLSLWPLTTTYLSGVGAIILVAQGVLEWQSAVIAFGVVTTLIFLHTVWREVKIIHTLVNSQHDALVARIDQLTRAMNKAGTPIPDDPGDKDTS